MSRSPTKERDVIADFFFSGEVTNLSGLSKYMIDYLCRHGLLTPSLSEERSYGKRRRFNFTDVLLARSIKALLTAGVTVLAMRRTLATLRNKLHIASSMGLMDKRIVIVGGRAYFSEPHVAPTELTANGQMAFSFVLEIESLGNKAKTICVKREAATLKRLQVAAALRKRRVA